MSTRGRERGEGTRGIRNESNRAALGEPSCHPNFARDN